MIDYHCHDICRVTDTECQNAFEALLAGDVLRMLARVSRNGFSQTLNDALDVYECNSATIVSTMQILVPLERPFDCLSDSTNNSKFSFST